MEEVLKNYSDIHAVFAQNDEMALGAIQAISTRGNAILVVGFDGIPDAIVAVNEGEMAATIAQQPDQIGVLGIDVADQYFKGQKINKSILVDLKLIEKE
jgi:ribose transport system substrate-binding protein